MKKVMLLVVTVGLLVFSVVTSAFASTAYLDYTIGGNEKAGSTDNIDRDNFLLGVEVPLDQYKVVFEYGKGTIKYDTGDTDTTAFMLKGGYRLVQNDAFQLYGDLSYSHLSWDASGDPKYSPIMIGVDGKYAINERMFVSGNLDFAVSGKYDNGSDKTDTDYTVAKVKYTYLLSNQIGVAAGYNWSEMKPDGSDKTTDTGATLGLTYNF
ncbi:MAG TPA: hypothetical protein DDW65_23990 [Firmicutes bacterium]|nr:hypothetical protein [Bacillota bacterium]